MSNSYNTMTLEDSLDKNLAWGTLMREEIILSSKYKERNIPYNKVRILKIIKFINITIYFTRLTCISHSSIFTQLYIYVCINTLKLNFRPNVFHSLGQSTTKLTSCIDLAMRRPRVQRKPNHSRHLYYHFKQTKPYQT